MARKYGFVHIGLLVALFIVVVVSAAALTQLRRRNLQLPQAVPPQAEESPHKFGGLDTSLTSSSQVKVENIDHKILKDEVYGFELQYPSKYSAEISHGPGGGSIYFKNIKGQFILIMDVEGIAIDEVSQKYPSFQDYAVAEAKLYCDADGPVFSSSCPDTKEIAPFTTKNGLHGYEIYLKEAHSSFDDNGVLKTYFTGEIRLVFVIDITQQTKNKVRGIFVKLSSDQQKDEVRSILDSIKF